MGGALGQPQAALAPKNAGQFLNQMLLGRPLRGVLGDQGLDEGSVFVHVLPGQHSVARQQVISRFAASSVLADASSSLSIASIASSSASICRTRGARARRTQSGTTISPFSSKPSSASSLSA